MYVFAGVKLNFKQKLLYAFQYVFGLGFSRINYVMNLLGLSCKTRVFNLNYYKFISIVSLFKNFYLLDENLKQRKYRNIQHLLDVNNYRGIRFKQNLPLNGQKTKTNARTRKKGIR